MSRSVLVIALASCASSPAPAPELANNAPPAEQTVALAIVFNGMELWTGNDDFETDPAARYPGALHDLETAIDHLGLPHGSEVTVIAYATGARVVVPWTRVEALHGSQLGDQHAYRNQIGDDLVQGVIVGLGALERVTDPRKVVLVLGDGNDTNNEAGKAELARQARRAVAAHVAVAAIIWKSAVSSETEIVDTLAPGPKTIARPVELGPAIAAVTSALH
jgi:hypothetical protein